MLFSQRYEEIICRPSNNLQQELQQAINKLAQKQYLTEKKFVPDLDKKKFVLDLDNCTELQKNDLNLIIALFQEANTQDLEFQIVHANDCVYKTLIYASLEFLDVVACPSIPSSKS